MATNFFAENLTYLLKKKGLSNAYVAGVMGRGRQLITDYKNGANPSFEILLKLAEILDLSLDDLVYKNLAEYDIEVNGQTISLEQQKNYLVPARAQAGTTLEWSQEVLNRFERVHIPGIYGEARTWEVHQGRECVGITHFVLVFIVWEGEVKQNVGKRRIKC